ncbi:hypothetical protein C7S16_5014 [Burkholderia thailandensis]|uniref:Uncharacterized protein n=1 Tax=Burkholderia thailandensis TaxID=57975 RepID=A0AAW9CK61_BURTH|nr:hypothetical protein [Burkholderia thailandensis]
MRLAAAPTPATRSAGPAPGPRRRALHRGGIASLLRPYRFAIAPPDRGARMLRSGKHLAARCRRVPPR